MITCSETLTCWLLRSLPLVWLLAGCAEPTLSTHAADGASVRSIGVVQGVVPDTGPVQEHGSDLVGRTVRIQGVVTQLGAWKTRDGSTRWGAWLQNLPSEADGDSRSSDGLQVYLGRRPELRYRGKDRPITVGDHLRLSGQVQERYGQTELSEAGIEAVLGQVALRDIPVADLPVAKSKEEVDRAFERLEGMRVRLPQGSIATGPRKEKWQTGDHQQWMVHAGHPVAQRPDAAHRRVYRDPHPLDDQPHRLFDNDNAWMPVLGSYGLMALDPEAGALTPARTGDHLAADAVGALHYSYNTWLLAVEAPVQWTPGPDPLALHPLPPPKDDQLTVVSYNLENLYDAWNDPEDGCDAPDDVGCPNVRRPFNYLPAEEATYRARLQAFAEQIVDALHAPDILMLQEFEDQDGARLVNGALVYGGIGGGDGAPDILQELALAIVAAGGPEYAGASDRDGADERGITCGFMWRTDRVEKMPPAKAGRLFGTDPRLGDAFAWQPLVQDAANPKSFNAGFIPGGTGGDAPSGEPVNVFSRTVQAGAFRVWPDAARTGDSRELVLLVNHFSSRPDARVERRTRQAALNAHLAGQLLQERPERWVIVGGDLNVFPRPDDPFAGQPSDQLGSLYELGLRNTHDRMLKTAPATAYTYVYQGQAGTLDHLFLSPAADAAVTGCHVVHLNADYTTGASEGDPPRGVSDHDPVVVRLDLDQ